MEKVYKHITIYKSDEVHSNHPVFGIVNTKHQHFLGFISYEPNWKQYVFSSNREDDVIFSVSCLKDIIDFIENHIHE